MKYPDTTKKWEHPNLGVFSIKGYGCALPLILIIAWSMNAIRRI